MEYEKEVTILNENLPITESLFHLEQYPLIDVKKIIKKYNGRKSVVVDLLTSLVKEILPSELSDLKLAYTHKDWNLIRKFTHKLKGCSLFCGATRINIACEYLESYSLNNYNEILENLYKQLIHVITETKQYAENWLKSQI